MGNEQFNKSRLNIPLFTDRILIPETFFKNIVIVIHPKTAESKTGIIIANSAEWKKAFKYFIKN